MDYPGILKVVKIQHPELTHKQAMKKAKEMFAKFKAASAELAGTDTKSMAEAVSAGTIATDVLLAAEKRLRAGGANPHSVVVIGREIMPGGKLVNYGKSGMNTLVTFEDGMGNRLPVAGYFVVWL